MRKMNTKFNKLRKQTGGAAISSGDLATDGGDYPTGFRVGYGTRRCSMRSAGSSAAMAMEG
jgi:hypothetical protein